MHLLYTLPAQPSVQRALVCMATPTHPSSCWIRPPRVLRRPRSLHSLILSSEAKQTS